MKIGDKIVFKYYKNIPNWKLDVFEIADITSNGFSIKTKTKNNVGTIVDIYSHDVHKKENFITLKEYRKEKLLKLNQTR